MSRTSRIQSRISTRLAVAGIAAFALATSACGAVAERVAEEGIERAIENESGGDVDLDLDGDGGFSIQTEDGSIRVGEDGEFIVEGADGEVITGQADGDDGSFVVESENGTSSFRTVTDIPEEWPASVPQPDGLANINGTVAVDSAQVVISISGGTSASAADYFAAYGAQLEAAGFPRLSYFEGSGTFQAEYDAGEYDVSLIVSTGDPTTVVVNIFNR